MRAAARLLAVLILAAAVSAIAQEKHLVDPTPPGSLRALGLADDLRQYFDVRVDLDPDDYW
jgi:hypothetical protein